MLLHDIILMLFIACLSACFSYLLDYCFGHPGKSDCDEVNEHAIFFFWSFYLAAKRKKVANAFLPARYSKDIFCEGRDLFSWEMAFGMCIYCTGIWIALFLFSIPALLSHHIVFYELPKTLLLLSTPIFSHFILRKI